MDTFGAMPTKVPDVIYEDDDFVAVHKDAGLLVHPSPMARDADTTALEQIEHYLGQKCYTLHRLDRKTSGVLVFGKRREVAQGIQQVFVERRVQKKYLAIVRGHFPQTVLCDRSLLDDNGHEKTARTSFSLLSHGVADVPTKKHRQSRYSLVHAIPDTGRYHQIRRHLNGLSHPIIGDRPHGCSEQNRLMIQHYDSHRMYLHAEQLSFSWPPGAGEQITVVAPLGADFLHMIDRLGLKL